MREFDTAVRRNRQLFDKDSRRVRRQLSIEHLEDRNLLAVMTEVPLVGGVTPDAAKISLRTDEAAAVAVQYSTDSNFTDFDETTPVVTASADDFTTIVGLSNLQPETTYYYRVIVDGEPQQDVNFSSFSTFPPMGSLTDFSFAVTADVHNIQIVPNRGAPAYEQAANDSPSFLLQIGDFDHRDPPTLVEMRAMHRQVRDASLAHGADFSQHILSSTPVFHVWDDHDYGINDGDKTFPGRADALQAFKEYYPTHELANPDNGIWHKFRHADAEFFMLDTRSQRDEKSTRDGPDKSMLDGDNIPDGQKDWLKDALLNSTAMWKFIISSVSFNLDARAGSRDMWKGYAYEQDELRQFIQDNDIRNVIVISADLHTGGTIDDGTNSGIGLPEISVGHTNLGGGNTTGTWSEGFSLGNVGGGYALITVNSTTDEIVLQAKGELGEVRHSLTIANDVSPEQVFYYSTTHDGNVTNSDGSTLSFASSDIVKLNVSPNGDYTHTLFFDGSDVGLRNLNAFDLREDGSIVVSTHSPHGLKTEYLSPEVGSGAFMRIEGEDLLSFSSNSLGGDTTGAWTMLLDGSDVGLTDRIENIKAVSIQDDDTILLSTHGNFNVNGASGTGNDIVKYDTSLDTWSLYFDGSDVDLVRGRERIDGLTVDAVSSTIHFATLFDTFLDNVTLFPEDVAAFHSLSLGENTAGTVAPALTMNGSLYGLSGVHLDGFDMQPIASALPTEANSNQPRSFAARLVTGDDKAASRQHEGRLLARQLLFEDWKMGDWAVQVVDRTRMEMRQRDGMRFAIGMNIDEWNVKAITTEEILEPFMDALKFGRTLR